jgi:hypothetical protein
MVLLSLLWSAAASSAAAEPTPEAAPEAPEATDPAPAPSSSRATVWFGGQTGGLMGWSSGPLAQPKGSAERSALGGPFGHVGSEIDLRIGWRKAVFRLDLDVNIDPFTGEVSYPGPEWAMIQVGGPKVRGRFGIINPQIGLEDWDRWNNYLPTWSVMFNGATPGRILGAEVAGTVGDFEVFGFVGDDVDFAAPDPSLVMGVGISGERDTWATWSGVVGYPLDGYYAGFFGFDFYPAEEFWFSIDGGAGVSGTSPFFGGQVVLNPFPEEVVQPVVRGEYVFDPDGAALGGSEYGIPLATASVGLRSQPLENMSIMVEGKATVWPEGLSPGIFVSLDFFRPEPSAYAVSVDE